MKCFVLGPAGTNGHEVAERIWPQLEFGEPEIVFCKSNTEILDSCAKEGVGVVPVENSTAGLVSEVVEHLVKMGPDDTADNPHLQVYQSIIMPIRHCLAVKFRAEYTYLKMVISHPQALAQCAKNLNHVRVEVRNPSSSTAEAAKQVANSNPDEKIAAICSPFAAKNYGLKIWQDNLQDSQDNATKFYLFGRPNLFGSSASYSKMNSDNEFEYPHSTVIFDLDDKPSALADALWAFGGGRGINLTSIHSIPTGKMGRVSFWCEFHAHHFGPEGKKALDLLRQVALNVRVFGSFYTQYLD